MTALSGQAAKTASRVKDANRARQKKVSALQREWVLESQLTPAELVAERDRLRSECMARHPSWFGITS